MQIIMPLVQRWGRMRLRRTKYGLWITALTAFLALAGCSLLENGEGSTEDDTLTVLALLLATNGSSSDSGCKAGGTCKMFISNSTSSGNMSGISGADAICNGDTSRPADGSNYKALISDGTNRIACTSANCTGTGVGEHVDWVLKPSTRYVNSETALEVFTTNENGIFPFGVLANQFTATNKIYFVAMGTDWTSSTTQDCSNWSVGTPTGQYYLYGESTSTDGKFIQQGSQRECDQTARLLCVQQ